MILRMKFIDGSVTVYTGVLHVEDVVLNTTSYWANIFMEDGSLVGINLEQVVKYELTTSTDNTQPTVVDTEVPPIVQPPVELDEPVAPEPVLVEDPVIEESP